MEEKPQQPGGGGEDTTGPRPPRSALLMVFSAGPAWPPALMLGRKVFLCGQCQYQLLYILNTPLAKSTAHAKALGQEKA